jgi:hypothetical protein
MEHICSAIDTWNITVEAKSGQPVTKQTNKQVEGEVAFKQTLYIPIFFAFNH